MKKIILIIAILFISSSCLAASVTNAVRGVVGQGAAAACAESANEINSRRDTVDATAYSLGAGLSLCFQATADCSGSLGTAYLYHDSNTKVPEAKVCVYTEGDADAVADADDVGVNSGAATCSASIATGATGGWKTGAFSTGTVTTGQTYWLCVFVSSTDAWDTFRAGTGTIYYTTLGDLYSTPPANLSALVDTVDSFGPIDFYVTIK